MTNGIKIPITGDLSGLKSEVNEFGRSAAKTMEALNGKATVDTTAAQRDLNSLGRNAKQSVEELKKVQRELREIERLQKALAKAGHNVGRNEAGGLHSQFQHLVKNGGAWGKKFSKFGDLATYVTNHRDLSPNANSSQRAFAEMMGQLGLHGAGGGHNPNPAAPSGGMRDVLMQSLRRAGSGIGGALPGNAGQIVGDAAGAAGGMRGLMSMRGLGMLAGGGVVGGLAYGAMRAIGAVRSSMRSSDEESISYADLSRRMNLSGGSFDALRGSVRGAASGMDVSYSEGSHLADRYAKMAGDGTGAGALGAELRTAGRFSRGLGVGVDAGADLMGTLRHNKVTSNDSDNKRFAMLLAEAIAHAGVFSKADEVLAAVGQYTAVATRAQFSAANAEGYIGGMHGLLGTGLAGMDPNAASAVMGKLDSGIRNPASEAARVFMLGTMQRRMGGLNALDMGSLLDGGAFGTAQSAFGEKSAAYRAAQASGDTGLMSHYRGLAAKGGDTTNIDAVLGAMKGQGTDFMRTNMKGMFGMSDSEANATITAYQTKGSMSAAVKNLSKYGLDMGSLDPSNIRAMVSAEWSNPEELRKQAGALRGKGTKAQNAALESALGGTDESALREAVVKMAATQNMAQTQGDDIRKGTVSLENLASDIATKLIPYTNEIRLAIVSIAEKWTGFKSTIPATPTEKIAAITAAATAPEKGGLRKFGDSVVEGVVDIATGNRRSGRIPEHALDQAAEAEGLTPMQAKTYKAIIQQESGNGVNAKTSIDGAQGAGQIMPSTFRQYAKKGERIDNAQDNIRVAARIVRDLGKRGAGDDPGKLAVGYFSGPGNMGTGENDFKGNAKDGNGKSTASYARDIERQVGQMPAEKNVPAGAKPPQASHTLNIRGEFNVIDPATGQPRAAPLQLSGIRVPMPMGLA